MTEKNSGTIESDDLNKTKENIEKAKSILRKADACIILTGAGMGVDSGLDVFRGKEGLWEKFPEAKELDMSFEDLANPYKYLKHPEVVIPFYLERLRSYQKTEPHEGYYELLEYTSRLRKGCFAVTSNVDGFFQKSFFNPENIYEIHGSINHWQCSSYKCSRKQGEEGLVEMNIDDLGINDEKITLTKELDEKLRCPICGEYLRPNLLMFFDSEWVDYIYEKQNVRFDNFRYSLYDKKMAIIEIGAGEKIRSIKSLAESLANDFNTPVIRINPEISDLDKRSDLIISIEDSGMSGIKKILENV